jgi:eukaryotic-like serine/threonine-protein kinase
VVNKFPGVSGKGLFQKRGDQQLHPWVFCPIKEGMKLQGPRELALAAVARGWIGLGAVWDIAARGEKDHTLSIEELFEPFLSSEMLTILQEEGVPEQSATVIATKSSKSNQSHPGAKVGEPLPYPKMLAVISNRYQLGSLLGEGGSGKVFSAFDGKLERPVAFKSLKDEEHKERFLREARLTAQLEHPSIVPVYDVETPAERTPFYTMRVVKRNSLREVLRLPLPREGWPLAKLCAIFVQVCRAVAYAHSRNIVHRDLKPENILLGDYGEVYVADWGIAKQIGEADHFRDGDLKAASSDSISGQLIRQTEAGVILGTVGYIAPEQIRNETEQLDHRADLFALGIILYQILTSRRPFRGKTAKETLHLTLHQEPQRPRERNADCPLVLDELCLRLLAKRPGARPASAEEVANEVEAFLEGSKEKERRRQVANQLSEQAKGVLLRYYELLKERALLLDEAKRSLEEIKPSDPIEKKLPAWQLQDEAEAKDLERAYTFTSAVEMYSQALTLSPDLPDARAAIASLYLSKVEDAEAVGDEPSRIYYESLALEYDEGGYCRDVLHAEAHLSLITSPPGAQIIACRYTKRDRLLITEAPQVLGRSPLNRVLLEPGSYLLLIRGDNLREARYPLRVRRGEHHQEHVKLYTDEHLGPNMCYIPAGDCTIGGDKDAVSSLSRELVSVPNFVISRFAVTLGEYAEFLNDLQKSDPAQVLRRAPHERNSSFLHVMQRPDGRWVPDPKLVSAEGRLLCPGERILDLPVTAIDWFDAMAYCRWKSARDGVFYRLPAEVEYEKAARGVDERIFPWGDFFDPLFCKSMDSRVGFPQMEPVGAFPIDESPYGVRDLAGSTRCWVADIHIKLDLTKAMSEPEDGTNEASRFRMARGGSWLHSTPHSRSASRSRFVLTTRYTHLGFRLVRPLR